VVPFGSGSLNGLVSFDIDSDGIADATGTPMTGAVGVPPGATRYQVTLTWAQLLKLGDSRDTPRTVTVQAMNDVNLSTTVTSQITITDVRPAVSFTDGGPGFVGHDYTISAFTRQDQSPIDKIVNWVVDWGDGSAVQTFGSTVAMAIHSYNGPSTY